LSCTCDPEFGTTGPRGSPHREKGIIKIILYSQFSQKITSNIHSREKKIKKLQIIYTVGKKIKKLKLNIGIHKIAKNRILGNRQYCLILELDILPPPPNTQLTHMIYENNG
jgi:hypothetical protein